MKKIIVLILFAILYSNVFATTYYVAPTGGSDSNPGTISSPWATWAKAFTTAQAGDIVYFRGGVWYPTTSTVIDGTFNGKSGTASNYINYFAYPGEVPILDCINKKVHGDALFLSNINYVHLKGLTVRNNKESVNDDLDANGFTFQYNEGLIVENCTSYGNGCRGIYFAEVASATVLNCDTYNNISERSTGTFLGNHGNGLIFTGTTTGQPFDGNITVTGCRSWGNSDSGFTSNCGGVETWTNNWSFDNGRLAGEGCGFKYLPGAWLGTGVLSRIMHNNIAAHNGFGTTNHDDGSGFNENGAEFDLPNVTLDNNLSYGNYTSGFTTYGGNNGARASRLLRNNIAYANATPYLFYNGNPPTDTYNTWNNANLTITDADFQSVDYTQLSRARKADGSLPDITFGKLAAGSRLIDAGTNVGLPFSGTTSDLGYSESSLTGTATIPIYQSSAIENATPAVVDMIFNTSLANIVPSASAFTVTVNSVARTVSSVAVSATKVSLTLAGAAISGDIITVAYTKPASNPLQTSSGGQAASITSQPVTNKVAAVSAYAPVYVSSSIENTTPSILTMTYSLSLANIVPAVSAFSVKVNSVARTSKFSFNLRNQSINNFIKSCSLRRYYYNSLHKTNDQSIANNSRWICSKFFCSCCC